MPSALPLADPAPADGLLPATVAEGLGERDFGVYVHVPFCRVRCGYCDFNTYTAAELLAEAGGRVAGHEAYAGTVLREVELSYGGIGIGVDPDAGAGATELGQRVGVEVAVAAAHRAERDVDVDAEVRRRKVGERRCGNLARRGRRVAVGKGGGRHTPIVSAVTTCHVHARSA